MTRREKILEAKLVEIEAEFDPLLGRGHLGDAAPHLLDVLELLLVGQVEGVPGVFEAVEHLVGLRPEDVQKSLENAHVTKDHRGGSSPRRRAKRLVGARSTPSGRARERSGAGHVTLNHELRHSLESLAPTSIGSLKYVVYHLYGVLARPRSSHFLQLLSDGISTRCMHGPINAGKSA